MEGAGGHCRRIKKENVGAQKIRSVVLFGLGQLVRWLGPIGALILLSTIQAVTLGLFPLAETLTALYVVAAAFGLGYGGVLPSYPIIIREYLSAKGAGARTGIVVFFGTVGMALGSGLGGISYDMTQSYAPAFYAGVLLNTGNLIVLAYLFRKLP